MIKQGSNFADKISENIRKNLAKKLELEPAWKQLTYSPGIDVWRINSFKLESIPKQKHGTFYDGDSYIILHTYESKSKAIYYDVFIWIGKHSTPDEFGTAAYKMAELDVEVLNDAAIQHREIQDSESQKFLSLFPKLTIMKGGVTSGFREVKVGEYTPKLFHICGIKANVQITQISYRKNNLTEDDVYIIDLGEYIYQINGKSSSKEEKFKGMQVVNEMKSQKGKCKNEIIDEYYDGLSHPVIDSMPVKEKSNDIKTEERKVNYSLWKVSDETGSIKVSNIKKEKASLKDFDTKDVFLYDTNKCIFVWVGKETSKTERMLAMTYAQKYAETNNKVFIPIEKVSEGNEPTELTSELI